MESTINVLIGLLCIILGILLIGFYRNLVAQKKQGGLSFKLQTAGIGLIFIGIGLIIREISK
jgi:hypothetical protein